MQGTPEQWLVPRVVRVTASRKVKKESVNGTLPVTEKTMSFLLNVGVLKFDTVATATVANGLQGDPQGKWFVPPEGTPVLAIFMALVLKGPLGASYGVRSR